MLKQNIADHKQKVDKLNKMGSALVNLVGDGEVVQLQEVMDLDNMRFDDIKNGIRERTNTLDEALQQNCEVCYTIDVHVLVYCMYMYAYKSIVSMIIFCKK